jgi:hypothetical protein
MCLYAKYIANMTQVSDVAHGPLVDTTEGFGHATYACRVDVKYVAKL